MDHAKNTIVTNSSIREDENCQQTTLEISEGHGVNLSTIVATTLTQNKKKTEKFKLMRSIPNLFFDSRKEFQDFSRHLVILKNIKGLELNFSKSQKIDLKKSKALSPLASSFKGLSSVENIKLDLNCGEINRESLRNLGESLKRMNSLERLSFDFSFCSYLTEKGLEALIKPLQSHLSLKEFSLDLSCTGSRIEYLMESFQEWRSLEKLSLNLYACGINDLNLTTLSEGLEKLRTPLKSLLLNFGYVGPVTEGGVQVLCQGIEKHQTSLQNLELIFSGCIEIDNRGLCYLGESLPKFSQLKTLILGFDSCFDLNDTGLKNLGKGLETLSGLQSLGLNFYSCNITDEGLKALNYNLQELMELTKIDCDFEKCAKITPKALEDFELDRQSLIARNT